MRPDNLRVGVVGLGVGERHVAGYQAIDGVEVVAVCDIDPVRLAEVGDRRGISRRATDYRAITEADDIDAVSICSFDDAHAEQVVSAFNHGKHVMVEKPVALTQEELEAVREAHATSGRILTSNLILRAAPRFMELRDAIARGDYGEVFYLEGDYIHAILHKITEGWRGRIHTYSVIYGGGIHLIDLMRWLLQDEIVEVSGMGTDVLTRGSSYGRPDTTVNLLRFAGGALAKTTTTFGPVRPKFHALNVYGTRATFVNDLGPAHRYTGTDAANHEPIHSAYPPRDKGDHLPRFVEAIRGAGGPPVSAQDVFRVMEICLACEEAIRTRATIDVRSSSA